MSLLVPLALLGLLTLPVILLLHLLRNRRELLPISSLRLWRGLQQKRQGALPRNIPLSLMLILQLLIAVALSVALSQPVLSFLRSQPQHLIFVLDTTTSMLAQDARLADTPQFISENTALGSLGRRFDLARQAISGELEALQAEDTFTLINLNRRPEVLFAGDGSQKIQAQFSLDNLIPGGTGLDLPAALTLANSLLVADRPNRIIVLTDGNYPVEAERLPEVMAPLTWQSFGAGPSAAGLRLFANQALLNVSSRPLPDGQQRIFARIINYGQEAVERTVRILADDRSFDEVTVQLAAQAETTRVWTVPASTETVTVEIVEPDVLPEDNRADLLLLNASRYQVLLLSEQAAPANDSAQDTALIRALQAQPGLALTVADLAAWRTQPLDDFDLIVFDGWPADLTEWPKGNLLVINPPLGQPQLAVDSFARNLRPDLEARSALLAGVDLSGVYFNRLPQVTAPAWATVDVEAISTATSRPEKIPLIFHGQVGHSRIVVWAFDLAQSNLSARLALPLLTGNTLATLLSTTLPAVVPLGEPVLLAGNVTIETPGKGRLAPAGPTASGQAQPFTRTKQPGLYRIFTGNGTLVGGFAVQAGSALESNLTTHFDPAQLIEIDIGVATAPPITEFQRFWPWLAGAALGLMMVEGWLAWRI